jgi:hypothetical protein
VLRQTLPTEVLCVLPTHFPVCGRSLAKLILYRQVDRDDNDRTRNEQDYVRIKILTEEGRKYADVEISYFHEQGTIVSLPARTIRPDGSIAMFEGKAYDKQIVKAKGVKYLAKTLTLPDVQVGSIIEYHYTYDMTEHYIYDSHWLLSDELFTGSCLRTHARSNARGRDHGKEGRARLRRSRKAASSFTLNLERPRHLS